MAETSAVGHSTQAVCGSLGFAFRNLASQGEERGVRAFCKAGRERKRQRTGLSVSNCHTLSERCRQTYILRQLKSRFAI